MNSRRLQGGGLHDSRRPISSQVDCDKPRDPPGLPLQFQRPTDHSPSTSSTLSHTNPMASVIPDTTPGTAEQPAASTGPVPMSFPAILRAPKLADRFAHLRLASGLEEPTSDAARLVVKKDKREDREGKRWVRRKENCTFPTR